MKIIDRVKRTFDPWTFSGRLAIAAVYVVGLVTAFMVGVAAFT